MGDRRRGWKMQWMTDLTMSGDIEKRRDETVAER